VSAGDRICAYCGWSVAKIRRPGEPATCLGCRDLPAAERRSEAELERELARHYNGDQAPRS
jgi:hypothetical protein